MKRFLPVLAVAALIAVPAATARPSAPPTLEAGKLIVAFGDPAPGFASGTVRGSTVTNPRGYRQDVSRADARGRQADCRVRRSGPRLRLGHRAWQHRHEPARI